VAEVLCSLKLQLLQLRESERVPLIRRCTSLGPSNRAICDSPTVVWGSRAAIARRTCAIDANRSLYSSEETLPDIEPKVTMAPTPTQRRACPGIWPTHRWPEEGRRRRLLKAVPECNLTPRELAPGRARLHRQNPPTLCGKQLGCPTKRFRGPIQGRALQPEAGPSMPRRALQSRGGPVHPKAGPYIRRRARPADRPEAGPCTTGVPDWQENSPP